MNKKDVLDIIDGQIPDNIQDDLRGQILLSLKKDLNEKLITVSELKDILSKYSGGNKKNIRKTYKKRSRKFKLNRK